MPTFPKTALSAFRSWRTFLSARRGDVPCPWDCSFLGNNEQRQFAPPYPVSPHLCPQPTAFMGHLTSSFCSFNIFCSFSYSFFLLYPRFSWHDSPLNRNPASSITEKHGQILLSPLENTKAGCIRATEKNISKNFSSRLDPLTASCPLQTLSLCSWNSPRFSSPALAISCLLHLSLLTFHIYSFMFQDKYLLFPKHSNQAGLCSSQLSPCYTTALPTNIPSSRRKERAWITPWCFPTYTFSGGIIVGKARIYPGLSRERGRNRF